MAVLVAVDGATISCKGTMVDTTRSTVEGTCDVEATGCDGSILTKSDKEVSTNIIPFSGACKFRPFPIFMPLIHLPCQPIINGEWRKTSKGFGDSGERILTENSCINCTRGAIIEITDPNQDQIETSIVRAHADAIKLLEDKLNDLENNWNDPAVQAEFERWFGPERDRDWGWLPFKDDRFDRHDIIDRIKDTIEALEEMDEDNFKPGDTKEVKGPRVNAFVYSNDEEHTVYIADNFTNNDTTGAAAGADNDSQAGILVHETAHFDDVAGLEDIEHDECVDKCYGNTESEALATNDPEAAEKNTDNFQGYIQS